jgi:prolipoprotein diacylglyceryltransferase
LNIIIEYTKEIQEAFEASLPIDMGQILSIPFIILGVYCMLRARNIFGDELKEKFNGFFSNNK